jgi:hypothetical protein
MQKRQTHGPTCQLSDALQHKKKRPFDQSMHALRHVRLFHLAKRHVPEAGNKRSSHPGRLLEHVPGFLAPHLTYHLRLRNSSSMMVRATSLQASSTEGAECSDQHTSKVQASNLQRLIQHLPFRHHYWK